MNVDQFKNVLCITQMAILSLSFFPSILIMHIYIIRIIATLTHKTDTYKQTHTLADMYYFFVQLNIFWPKQKKRGS